MNTLLGEITEKLGQDSLKYVNPIIHFYKGYPRKHVPELAVKINVDLVVMGTVARTGIPDFLWEIQLKVLLTSLIAQCLLSSRKDL